MAGEISGLMYIPGVEGDYVQDPRKIVPALPSGPRPKTPPFLIRNVTLGLRGGSGSVSRGVPGQQQSRYSSAIVTRDVSKATPVLGGILARGTTIAELWIHLSRPDEEDPYLRIRLGNAYISGLAVRGADGSAKYEEIEWVFETLDWEN